MYDLDSLYDNPNAVLDFAEQNRIHFVNPKAASLRLVLLIYKDINLDNIIIPDNIKELFIYNNNNYYFNITIPGSLRYLYLGENITNQIELNNINHLECSTKTLQYLNYNKGQLTIIGQYIDLYYIPITVNKLVIKIDYNTIYHSFFI